MKIVNAMLSKGLGGIEQAFIDYAESLAMRGHEVFCVIRHGAKIEPTLNGLKEKYPEKIKIKKIFNFGKWDFSSRILLNKFLVKEKPVAVIAHGNRPCLVFRDVTQQNKVPLIGVVHNYWFKDVMQADFLFCVSTDIKNKLSQIFSADKVLKVPNLIRVGAEPAFKVFSEVPVIGVMARMVEKKGVDVFLRALAILKERGLKFSAVIAGDGDLRQQYQTLRDDLRLCEFVKFTGWVSDKQKFYDEIDIFCLPSHSEPFGIVLLEAMTNKKPIVSTNIEGPAEILTNQSDALLVEKNNPEQMADALAELLGNNEKAKALAEKGFSNAKNNYDIAAVAKIIEASIEQAVSGH